jgi:hypothetical protein
MQIKDPQRNFASSGTSNTLDICRRIDPASGHRVLRRKAAREDYAGEGGASRFCGLECGIIPRSASRSRIDPRVCAECLVPLFRQLTIVGRLCRLALRRLALPKRFRSLVYRVGEQAEPDYAEPDRGA